VFQLLRNRPKVPVPRFEAGWIEPCFCNGSYNPRSNFDMVVPSPVAITSKVMSPTSRVPLSISLRWPRFIPK
jgi:hypothetical protein